MNNEVGAAYYTLDLDDKNFKSGMANAREEFAGLEGVMKRAEHGSQMFATGLLAIGAAGIAAAGFGIKFAADLETMTQGFVTLLGSAEAADKAIEMIKKDAASTPFELPGLINANQLLTSVTKDAERSERMLLNVGKALTAMGKGQPELDRIIVNLQQIGAVGKASMIDIKQFAFAGIPIFDMLNEKIKETKVSVVDNSKAIGDKSSRLAELQGKLAIAVQKQKEFTDSTKESTRMTNQAQIDKYSAQIASLNGEVGALTSQNGKLVESQSQLEDMIKDGQITFELLEEMFNEAGEGAGRFAKAFELQGGTFNQVMSNFKDNIGIIAGELVQKLGIFDLAKQALQGVTDALADLATEESIERIRKFIADDLPTYLPVVTGLILGGLTPALYGLASGFIAAMAPLIPFMIAGAAIALAIQEITRVVQENEAIMKILSDLWNTVVAPALQYVKDVIMNEIVPALKEIWVIVEPVLVPLLKLLAIVLGVMVVGALVIVFEMLKIFINHIRDAIVWVRDFLTAVKTIFEAAANFIRNNVETIAKSILTTFGGIPGGIAAALMDAPEAIIAPFRKAFDWIKEKVNEVFQALDKLNPFHRESPSLVDKITKGVSAIQSQFSKLEFDITPVADLVPNTSFASTPSGGVGQQYVTINIDKVGDQQDVEAIGRELGFRTGLSPKMFEG